MTPTRAARITATMIRTHSTDGPVVTSNMLCALAGLGLALAIGTGHSAAAGEAPKSHAVLVELFTSQGCSSCPRADAFVSELAQLGYGSDRVIPLTFHVGYWNGPAWTDRFSQPVFDQRQDRYARVFDGPYTPQMVIDGRLTLVGSNRAAALAAIDRWRAEPTAIELSGHAERGVHDGPIAITVQVRSTGVRELESRDVELFAALYEKSATTAIAGGENGGRTLRESFVVRHLSAPLLLPRLTRAESFEFTLPTPQDVPTSNLGIAVFAQQKLGTLVLGSCQISIAP